MLASVPAVAQQTPAPAPSATTVQQLLTQALPDIKGKEVSMVTVEYAPGGKSSPHRHEANTFVFVLEGSMIMQVAGGKETTLGPGQVFYETPTDVHTVSRNASRTQPAKFLVFFIKNAGASTSHPPL